MPAMDALHLKHIFHDDVPGMTSFLGTFIDSVEGRPFHRGAIAATAVPNTFRPDETGESYGKSLSLWSEAAEAYYLDPRMLPLVTAACETMPQENIVPSDLPTQQGFLYVPHGLGVIDIRGNPLKYSAVLWSAFGGAVQVVWLTDKYDPEDYANIYAQQLDKGWLAKTPRLTLAHVTRFVFGTPLPVTVGPDFVIPPEMPIHVSQKRQPDGSVQFAWSIPEGYDAKELTEKFSIRPRTDPASRWLLTVWRLMQQTITVVEDEQPNRQQRRAMERANRPDVKVSVIRLRRMASRGEADSEVEWSHRWLVRGHWRNQPCKDENGEWTKRLIWIHPFIKGPEGLPLLVREHVYSLSR